MCLPATLAQRRVRSGHVQPFRADHQPMQPDEAQSFRRDRIAALAPGRRRKRRWIFGQREGRNFDALVAGFAN